MSDDLPVFALNFGTLNKRIQSLLSWYGVQMVSQLRTMDDVALSYIPCLDRNSINVIRTVVPYDDAQNPKWVMCPHCRVGHWEWVKT